MHFIVFLIHELIIWGKKIKQNNGLEHICFLTFIMHHYLPKMTMVMDENMKYEAKQVHADLLHDGIRHCIAL